MSRRPASKGKRKGVVRGRNKTTNSPAKSMKIVYDHLYTLTRPKTLDEYTRKELKCLVENEDLLTRRVSDGLFGDFVQTDGLSSTCTCTSDISSSDGFSDVSDSSSTTSSNSGYAHYNTKIAGVRPVDILEEAFSPERGNREKRKKMDQYMRSIGLEGNSPEKVKKKNKKKKPLKKIYNSCARLFKVFDRKRKRRAGKKLEF